MDYSAEYFFNDEILIIALVLIGFLLFIAFYMTHYLPFKRKRDYIKAEMKRAFKEHEYLYWKRELKMLYIRRIPIVRSIIRRRKKR